MIIDICCIVCVLLLISMCFLFANNLDSTNKKLKDISDKQFDAEQVMRLYEMRNKYRELKRSQHKIAEINSKIIVTREQEEFGYNKIKVECDLIRDISNQLGQYVEFVDDFDYQNMQHIYMARLRVVEPNKEKKNE